MAEKFSFSYVKGPAGSISGESVLQQTEDVINSVGNFAVQTAEQTAEALRQAGAAGGEAGNAAAAAANAVNYAKNALETARTVEENVSQYDQKISAAQASAASANQAASAAQDTANRAVNVANEAKAKVDNLSDSANNIEQNVASALRNAEAAASTAKDAKTLADEAKKAAQSAVLDANGIFQQVNDQVEEATAQAVAARAFAQDTGSHAATAQAGAAEAKKWATQAEDPVQGSEENGNALYSARYYALLTQAQLANAILWSRLQSLTAIQQWTAALNAGVVSFIPPTEGNVIGADGTETSVSFALTDEQKAQARANIAAAGVGEPMDMARADGDGNVFPDTYAKKIGNTGSVSSYASASSTAEAVTITKDSDANTVVTGAVEITVPDSDGGIAWDKSVDIRAADASVVLGTSWSWAGGVTPSIAENAVLILHWADGRGLATLQTIS